MKTVSKGKLKARMLEYFRLVEETGEPLIVTDRGREVLEVRPLAGGGRSVAAVLAEYRAGPGKGVVADEEALLEPEAPEDWEALDDKRDHPW